MSSTRGPMDPGGGPHLSERPTYRSSRDRLSSAQKTTKGAPAYSRFVNRPLGRRLAAAAHVGGLTPNQVTTLSAGCSLIAIVLVAFVPPTLWLGPLVVLALLLGYALDSADGQLARLRGGGSPAGEWLDHTVDVVKINLLHVAVAVSMYRWWDVDIRWVLIPLTFLVVSNVMFFCMILRDLLIARHRSTAGGTPTDTRPSIVRSLLVLPTDYGILCLTFVLLGGAPVIFLSAYGALLLGSAAFLTLALPKWYSDVRRQTL